MNIRPSPEPNPAPTRPVRMVSFVVPALNEEPAVAKTMAQIHAAGAALRRAGKDYEIVLVDGRSDDRTAALAETAGARTFSCDRGYGRQYRFGFGRAEGDVIVTGDCDGTYPFGDAPRLVRRLEEADLDFITTNRFAHLEPRSMTFSHFVGNVLLTGVANALFRVGLRDSQSGMWIFRRSALPRLSLRNDNMAFSQEIKIDAARAGLQCAELPITYAERIGKPKLRAVYHGWKNVCHLVRKRFGA